MTKLTQQYFATGRVIGAPSVCNYMTDLQAPLVANHPCKGNKIECSHPEVDKLTASVMSTRKCRPENCKYFTSNIKTP